MSFWTGFTTGLASSVDRGLQKAIEKRDGELSRAKDFWMQRKAAKLDAAEAEKLEFDKKAEKAYGRLADELGDSTLAYAAYQKLGGPDEVLGYLDKVQEARSKLQPGQTYNIADDFVGYKAGDTTLTREEARQRVRMQLPSFGTVSANDLAIDDKLGRLFRREGQAAEEAAATINKRFEQFKTAPLEELTGLGTIERIDLSRQVAAQEAAYTQTVRAREAEKFDMDVSAFNQNAKRIDQAMTIAASAEARAGRKEASDEDQRAVENARAEVAALQRQEQLSREAEMHIMDKRAKEIGIEKDEIELQKMKDHPEFKNYEDMAVYATQKLSAGGLTDQQVADFERMRQDAIDGAKAYNAATSTPEKPAAKFSNESRQSILNGEIKRVLEPLGLMTDIQGTINYKISGNEPVYFTNMKRALDNVSKQTSGLQDDQMNMLIQTQRDTLKEQMQDYKDKAINAQKNTITTKEQMTNVEFTRKLKPGQVVTYTKQTPDGERTISRIWTGTGYI
jgi:hypothetical protein